MAAVATEINEWRALATEAAEVLQVALADVALQSIVQESTWKEVGALLLQVKALQGKLAAKSVKLSQLTAKHGNLTNKVGR